MVDVLTFQVHGTRYAVGVASVQEILRASAIVPLPAGPAVIAGVIDYRGRMVPVLDLRARFGAPPRPLQADEHFVVVRADARLVALRADHVAGLARLDAAAVQPIASVVSRGEYVAGLAALEDGLVLIADPHAFLSESEGIMLDGAMGAAPGLAQEFSHQ